MKFQLFYHATVSLFLKGIGGVSGFFAAAMVSRLLGAEEAGLYFFSFALASVVAVLGRFGLDRTVLRIVSVSFDKPQVVSGLLIYSMMVIFLGSSLFSICIFFGADYIERFFSGSSISADCLRVTACVIPLMAMSSIFAEALQGLRLFKSAVYVLNISASIWLIALLFSSNSLGNVIDASTVVFYLGVAYLLTFLHGVFLLRHYFFSSGGLVKPDAGLVLSSCMPLYLTDVMSMAVLWSSQLIAAHWLRLDELAHVAVAQRTAALTSLLLLAFNTVTAPRFATLYSQGLREDLRRLAQVSTWAITVVAIPVVLVMCFLPEQILSVFGDEFSVAGRLLPILAIGQLVNAATGSVGYLLTMSGHEKDMRNIAVISGLCAIMLPFLLIPAWGVMGAVCSTAIAMSAQNVMALFMVKKRLGFWTLGFPGRELPQS